MEQLWDIKSETENKLLEFGFVQILGHDGGMYKSYEWANNSMTFGLYYDRGYFDCHIRPTKEAKNSVTLFALLKYLHHDLNFYDKELEEAKLWNTLPTADYFELFFSHYEKIEVFYQNYNAESSDLVKQFLDTQNRQ